MIAVAREVLELEGETLLKASEYLCKEHNQKDFLALLHLLANTQGKVVVTGVGKSGLVGAKIAATFASTGTPSFFMHPTEAMHGDLGMIGELDTIFALSYSGKSAEVLAILPHIQNRNIPIVSMSCNSSSPLAKMSKAHIDLLKVKEACPLQVAPTTSTTLTLALGDALAVCLMKCKNFKQENFARFHPGGSLGKQLFVKIKDLMDTKNLPFVVPQMTLQEVICVMTQGKIGSAIVVNNLKEQVLLGVLSDGDLRRAMMRNDFSLKNSIENLYTKNPIYCNNQQLLASEALKLIENHKIQMLVITDMSKKVLGVLHIHKLIEEGIGN